MASRPASSGTGSTSGNSDRSSVLSAWLWGTSPGRFVGVLDRSGGPIDGRASRSITSSRLVRLPNARFTGVSWRDAAGDGVDDDLGDGADVGEVARLGAVAVHGERFAGQRGVHERRDHGGVGVAGGLAGAEHVEEPERQGPQPVAALIRHRVLLGGELADRVRAQRLGGEPFVLRQRGVGAVHRRRRGDDHDRVVERAGRFEYPQRAGGVRLVAGDRVDDRSWHRRDRCEVDDRVDAAPSTTASASASGSRIDPSTRRRSMPSRLARLPGGQVVDADDLVAAVGEPSATCDPMKPAAPVTSTRIDTDTTCASTFEFRRRRRAAVRRVPVSDECLDTGRRGRRSRRAGSTALSWRRALALIVARSSAEEASSARAPPSAAGSRGGTTRPTSELTISGTRPTAVATTGTPRARASATTIGWPS